MVCECGLTSQTLGDVNLTFMMINDKAAGEDGGDIVQEHADCSGSHTLCEFMAVQAVDVEVC